ncbi:hypothetical protein CRM22_009184 [Opisthorchis felineus]|uniref:Uncharacterized protein n=1 Tax=Opisthorchis felineus TaxID=147828 RepID=A0A4S2L8P6_OPIFE|nr:hypothetical protein CRM22_009184 [Opisthorchis felineus]
MSGRLSNDESCDECSCFTGATSMNDLEALVGRIFLALTQCTIVSFKTRRALFLLSRAVTSHSDVWVPLHCVCPSKHELQGLTARRAKCLRREVKTIEEQFDRRTQDEKWHTVS